MKLRQLFEAEKKTAVAAFGRMNPPTIGHEKLVDAIKSQEGDHFLFLSQTQKPKDNPLPFNIKLQFAKAAFPGINVGHESVRTPIQMLQMLEKLGYTDVIYVAGSDRVEEFQKLFDTYNGKPNKDGEVPFKFNSIEVISAGERDPDASGAEGMSASKMRAAAAAGEEEAFAQGLPKRIQKDWENVYSAVRTGMGIKELEPTEDVSPEDEKKFHNELDDLVHKYFGDSPDEEKMKKKMRKVKEGPGYNYKQRFKRRELDTELGHETNNYAVMIDDKVWKIVASQDQARRMARTLMNKGKNVAVKITGMPVSEAKKDCPDGEYFCNDAQKCKPIPAGHKVRADGILVKEGDLVLNKSSLVNYMRDKIIEFVQKEDDVDKLSEILVKIAGKTVKNRAGKLYTISNEDVQMAFEAACKNGMYYCSTDKKMKCRKGPKQSRG